MQNSFFNMADYKVAAQQAMSEGAWHYVDCGADAEITKVENATAFERIKFIPKRLASQYMPDLSTTVLGQKITSPIMLAPVSPLTLIHEQGELAQARAAKAVGTIAMISTDCHYPLEEVVKESDSLWFQLYCYGDRGFLKRIIERVEQSGYKALVVTVDCTILGNRERLLRHQFKMPDTVKMGNLDGFFQNQKEQLISGSVERTKLTWDDIHWMRNQTTLPLIVKGLVHPDDAKIAADLGVDALVLSNHGGRQLDHCIPPIMMLEEIRSVVGDKIEVYVDGGIQRGTDVIKSICLGANAVLIGRSYLWGLAVAGCDGIIDVMRIFENEMRKSMIQLGVDRIQGLNRSTVRQCY
jgi:4-hydroxymandelate oxidase